MSQIWDVDILRFRLLGYMERSAVHLSRRRMLHIPYAHIPRSHVQWPGPSLGIRIGICPACKVKLTFRILAFLYKLTTQICHFDEFLLIKWPISKNYYPKLAGVRNVHSHGFVAKIAFWLEFCNIIISTMSD